MVIDEVRLSVAIEARLPYFMACLNVEKAETVYL
jgi:hypothetical protein